jgi:hypothetical protein
MATTLIVLAIWDFKFVEATCRRSRRYPVSAQEQSYF